tara:strand:+ start:54691 stop:55425 length:735 start_codon:yes stop_codon:yes gene_type:complete
MAIINYPNRTFRRVNTAIDRTLVKRKPVLLRGSKDVTGDALDVTIGADCDWQFNSVSFEFSNATSRNYTMSVKGGRRVVTNYNDYLWVQHAETLWQKITLGAGFYTGTELAAELQTQLQANAALAAESTLTVAYDAATGFFTVTSSTGNIKYIQTNNTQPLPDIDSIGGHLFGLTSDSAFGSTIVSDTTVYALNTSIPIIDESSGALTHYNDDLHVFDIDQALSLTSNAANVTITYEVNYEEMV